MRLPDNPLIAPIEAISAMSAADIGQQLGALAACAIIGTAAHFLFRTATRRFDQTRPMVTGWPVGFIVLTIATWSAAGFFTAEGSDPEVLRIAGLASAAITAAKLAIRVIGSTMLGWVVATIAVLVATLEILHLVAPVVAALDEPNIRFGAVRVSPWLAIKGFVAIAGLFWAAQRCGDLLDRSLVNERVFTRSGQALFAKVARISLYVVALVLSLGFLGVDATTLAVLSGALGLGLGFGFQRIISNYIAGFILLLDRSIKPGDVIEVEFVGGRVRGEVTELAGRYTAITLRTGTETLIPNEVLISSPVNNWSHRSQRVQVRIPVGIAYSSDVEKAIEVCVEAARAAPRVQSAPDPVCFIVGFGDSSVDLDVRFWITDAENGVRNVSSGVYLEIWKRFHVHGIEIPFPQRDLHLRSATPITISGEQS